MLMMSYLPSRSVQLNSLKFWFEWYQFHVNPSKTHGEMNILYFFKNIKTAALFLIQWVLLLKI